MNLHNLLMLKCNTRFVSPEKIVSKVFYNFKSLLLSNCDLYHFFNCINWDKDRKWVLSVESAVPWVQSVYKEVEYETIDFSKIGSDKYIKRVVERLADQSCLALLPLSRCSYNIQHAMMKQFPQYYEAVMKKTYVLHPPQDLKVERVEDKGVSWDEEGVFTFIYVGKNFFRKGGCETLDVLSSLKNKYNFRLILISSLEPDEPKYDRVTPYDVRQKIEENKSWIDFYEGLPNEEVIKKMKESHVCLLPTWMDTYAYSVLESQACGTPLITTSLRALTEINDESVGWLIDVPVNELNHPLHNTREEQERFHEMLYNGLFEKVEYVLTHRDEVKLKSDRCINKIRSKHSPADYSKVLERIYTRGI